jgi:hypothetical protein
MIRHVIAFFFAASLLLGGASVFGQAKKQPMTNLDVVKMVQSGMSEAAMINAVKTAANPNFELTNDAITALRQQKVPEGVVLAMIKRQWQVSSARRRARTTPIDLGPKWEVEVHGGIPGKFYENGSSAVLPEAAAYSLAGSGATGYFDKRVSSWYFGDGATLIGLSSTLNPVLTAPTIQPKGQLFGLRASRKLNRWLDAEFSYDRGGRYAITNGGLDEINNATSAFLSAWSRVNVPGNTPVTSASTVTQYGGRQNFTTGAIVISLPQMHRAKPYVTVGAGMLSSSGAPSFTIAGAYGGPSAPETDTVHVVYGQTSSHAFTELAGGGVKLYLSTHWGIRLDGRVYLYHNPLDPVLTATPTHTPNVAWIINATDAAGKSVEFLQKLSGPGLGSYTSLSGPAISGLRTYLGSGSQRQIPLTIGFFWRF